MNESSRIVFELQRKLAELDHRVWAYRRDMASEFGKYTDDLLRDVPTDVSETVARTMAHSMNGYRSLYPESPPTIKIKPCNKSQDARLENGGIDIPEPLHRPTEELHKVDLRSPHEREKEFRGVFTPNYLPLLDRSSRGRRSILSDSPSIHQASREKVGQVDASTEVTGSLAPSPKPQPSTSRQKNTEETSTSSDWSDSSTSRRSALRLSFNSSKGSCPSPRRVRFDFAGEEVLPTSSPLSSEPIFGDETSPPASDSEEDFDAEMMEYPSDPAPPRISSSQALRLLSRKSLEDDGTVWTSVYAPADGSASVAADNDSMNLPQGSEDNNYNFRHSKVSSRSRVNSLSPVAEYGNSSDNDSFNLPLSQFFGASPFTFGFPILPNTIPDIQESHNHNNKKLEFEKDDQALFQFDEIANQSKQPQPTNFTDDVDYDSYEEEEDFLTIRSSKYKSQQASLPSHSQSSAKTIPKILPTIATPKRTGLTNSFKEHPFSMPIVSPQIHAQAASLGAIDSFVGSVDGRTGLDENTLQYPGISAGVKEKTIGRGLRTGFPAKSLTERMRLEDLMEEDSSCFDDEQQDRAAIDIDGGG
ncbi:unnamed protein product [Blumeria hordei]|uniref:Uncharacterized protein n=1 Tax=Blumeria hordei TaxID=2867405 RepID=A0A383V1W5_BLUHO|nr:unnamed protein product [Blumeria hordei]